MKTVSFEQVAVSSLEVLGFTATSDDANGWMIQHAAFETFIAYMEVKGDLVIVSGDAYHDLAHGNVAAWTLLVAGLPRQSILIQCGDVSHLAGPHHSRNWEDVTAVDIHKVYPSRYQWLWQEVQELIDEWVAGAANRQATKPVVRVKYGQPFRLIAFTALVLSDEGTEEFLECISSALPSFKTDDYDKLVAATKVPANYDRLVAVARQYVEIVWG